MDIVSLILQVVAGVVGGNAVGAGAKNVSLGPTGNSITGGIGGLVIGQIVQALLMGGSGGGEAAGIVGSLLGGGVGGAVVTLVVGMIKNAMAKHA